MKVAVLRGRAIDPGAGKIAAALARAGHSVTLLVWDRDGSFEGGPAECTVRRFRLRAPYDRIEALLLVPLWIARQLWFLARERPQAVHACDLDTLLPAVAAGLLGRARCCYSIFDFYANNVPCFRPRLLMGLLRRFVALVENTLLRGVDMLFLADECRREEVVWRRPEALEFIYNSPRDSFAARPSERDPDRPFTVFYAGNMIEGRGLECMIEAVEPLEGVRLELAGAGPARGRIEESARHLSRVALLERLPYDEVLRRTHSADLLFRFSDPALGETRRASPNKVFEAMMCAKPILVSAGGAMAERVERERCGLVVPYGDTDAVRNAVRRLKDDPALREALGANGRRAYVERYGWPRMEQRLARAYARLAR